MSKENRTTNFWFGGSRSPRTTPEENINWILKFATYQSEKEEKTYVKFEPAPALTADDQAVILATNNLAACVDSAKAIAWQYAMKLRYDYSTYVPEGEPIFTDLISRLPDAMRMGNYRPDWIYKH